MTHPKPRVAPALAIALAMLLTSLTLVGSAFGSYAQHQHDAHTPNAAPANNTTNTDANTALSVPQGNTIAIFNNSYAPQFVTITVGSGLMWNNNGTHTHTVTADDGSFDSGDLVTGAQFSFGFNVVGDFPYHCIYHGGPGTGMYGVVHVIAAPPPLTPTNTRTPLPTQDTFTPAPSDTPTPSFTATPLPSNTPVPTATATPTWTPGGPTATPTPTDCPNQFGDIDGNIFYTAIHYLACRNVVNGTDATHFSPTRSTTRAQFAKMVVLAFNVPNYTPTGGTESFTDVHTNFFGYVYIEAGFHAGVLSGYSESQCPILGAAYPCYRPNKSITRAELTKLVVNAAGYTLLTPTGGATFVDVPSTSIFYPYIETAYQHGIIVGSYPNHFSPNRNIRRDEMAQIVYKGVTTP